MVFLFKILFEPIFSYHDHANDESRPVFYIIKDMCNRGVIETKMKEKISRILPGDNRVNRVGDTSFYTLTVLHTNVSEMDDELIDLNGFYGFDESIEGCQIGDNVFTLKLSVDTFSKVSEEIIHDVDLDDYIANNLRPRLNFSGADLRRVNFNNTNYSGANFSGADLTYSTFHDSRLIKANFTGAILSGTSFYKADMRKSILTETDFFIRNRRHDDDSTFTETNLRYANLAGVYFMGANFRDADLSHSDISNADFDESIIDGMLIVGAIGQPNRTLNRDVYVNEEEEEEYDTWGIVLINLCLVGKYVGALDLIKRRDKTTYNMSLQNPDGNTALGHVINRYDSITLPEKEELIRLLIEDFSSKYPIDDTCSICLINLDGVAGPGNAADGDNDVITVCVNSHRFHRKCILGVCNAKVKLICPMCRAKLIPSCANKALERKIKLPLPIPDKFKGFIPKKKGGRQIKKKPIKNKLKLVKTKTKNKKNKLVKTKTKNKKNKLVKTKTKNKKNKLVKTKTRKYTKP